MSSQSQIRASDFGPDVNFSNAYRQLSIYSDPLVHLSVWITKKEHDGIVDLDIRINLYNWFAEREFKDQELRDLNFGKDSHRKMTMQNANIRANFSKDGTKFILRFIPSATLDIDMRLELDAKSFLAVKQEHDHEVKMRDSEIADLKNRVAEYSNQIIHLGFQDDLAQESARERERAFKIAAVQRVKNEALKAALDVRDNTIADLLIKNKNHRDAQVQEESMSQYWREAWQSNKALGLEVRKSNCREIEAMKTKIADLEDLNRRISEAHSFNLDQLKIESTRRFDAEGLVRELKAENKTWKYDWAAHVSEVNDVVTKLKAELAALKNTVAERDADLVIRNNKIADLLVEKKKLENKKNALDLYASQLSECRDALREKNIMVEEGAARIAELKRELEIAKVELAEKDTAIKVLARLGSDRPRDEPEDTAE